MKLSEIMAAVPAHLEEVGWTQLSFRNDEGEVCIWGAIQALLRGERVSVQPIAASFFNVIGQDLTLFNDTAGRTLDEVIHACKLVAESLEEQGL